MSVTDGRAAAAGAGLNLPLQSSRASLELSGVHAGYGDFQALFGVGLRVDPGEAVGVVGPNGAGKTTLLRVISGLIRPTSGSLRFDGHDLATTPAHALPGLGIAHVPENRRLFPHLTVEENLKVGAFTKASRPHFEARRDRVYDLFPRMKQRRHQLAGTLSGGEQQMCAIGRALMCGPRILLLDEPSAGLAPIVVQQVFDLVRRIREEGLTVLIVEQNVAQVLRVVDRAYVLETGRVAAEGRSAELAADPAIRRSYLGGH
jgi:branched-chain amino acid transport system ATP-binding protein